MADTKGTAFAKKMIAERIASRNLPMLGNGYTDIHRAAYAVITVANRKLLGASRHEAIFWRDAKAHALAVQVADCNDRIAAFDASQTA